MPERKALRTAELEDGAVAQVPVDGRDPIALYRIGDEFFATDDICTHGHAFLSEGDVEDGDIVCPFHNGAFDIRTGEPTGPPCSIPIRTYPVRVGEDGYAYIDVPSGS